MPNDPLKDLIKGTGPPVPNMGGIPDLQGTLPPRPVAPPSFSEGTPGYPPGLVRPPSQGLPPPPPLSPDVLPPPPPEPVTSLTQEPITPPTQAPGVNITVGAPQAQQAQPSPITVLPGVEKSTLGEVSTDLDGQVSMRLNDLGKREWVRKREKLLADFGDFPGKDDPNAPQPKIEPGKPALNPFTGVWVGLE